MKIYVLKSNITKIALVVGDIFTLIEVKYIQVYKRIKLSMNLRSQHEVEMDLIVCLYAISLNYSFNTLLHTSIYFLVVIRNG